MKTARSLVLLFVLLLAGTAWAGTIVPALESQMQSLQGDETIKVLVVLRDQPDITTLDRQLHDNRATRLRRHEEVLGALQDAAERSQGPLLAELSDRQRSGGILGFTPHWLVNAVVVVGTEDAIRALAQRDDVEVIEPNLEVELIEPLQDEKATPPGGYRGIGITPGVVAVGARRVWNELGIDGTGVVIGGLDTGVDGNHPALASRWRGLYADPSECWLDNSGQGAPDFPVDNNYVGHGTHTMGTMTGQAPDDTIGVAPGALWIAANTIDQGVSSEFDNDVIESLEWFADPDGNPETTEDVPCVVQNSWGTYEPLGYPDCFSYWWDAIDNCEAAGVVLTWSAGNEGPDAASLRSPADRADSPYNTFSVGSTQNYAPYEISDFSSRGPSACGGPYQMKPEISAPGSHIYSSQPGGGYQYLDGTSMAGPHVAGVVALMCSANPDLDHETIKQILMETAIDLGVPGEDNTYGHGFVNAYDAVLSVIGGLGTVNGIVTDADTGLPIEGVQVGVIDRPTTRTTGSDGAFEFMLPAGTWTLTFEAFGYGDETLEVDVPDGEIVDGSTTMAPLPTATLSGLVYDYEGALVSGATVEVLDTPLDAVYSNGSGYYSIDIPSGAGYDVVARKAGYGADQHTINFQGDMTLDFTLPELVAEDFETGGFQSYPWIMGGDADWFIDSTQYYEGSYSARSGDIGDLQDSSMEVTVEVAASGDISFWYKVSSEATYDFLRFYVDDVEVGAWSGTVDWTQFSYAVETGSHTFKWAYEKDYSVSTGQDCGWVDFIEFPTIGAPPAADITIDPTSIVDTVTQGETDQTTISLGNAGDADLDYSLGIQYGEPTTGFGGPDGFGYSWVDSDAPGGPTFDWADVTMLGDEVGGANGYGPFPLGFSFSYYGTTYDEIRVGPRGWLSFSSASGAYDNLPIPDPMEPNNLLAPFWDDLNPMFGGSIFYYADPTNDLFVVEWYGVWHFPDGPAETFEVVLRPNGTILYQYLTVADDSSCTIGIENADGTDGLEVLYNSPGYLHDDMAIKFSLEPSLTWLSVTPAAGTVGPEGSTDIEVAIDATNLVEGDYYAEIVIETNDPDTPEVVVPVSLTVSPLTGVDDGQLPSAVVFFGAVPNPFNPKTTLHFNLPNRGDVDLRIYDVAGRLVTTLVDGSRPAGENRVSWNGNDDGGHSVASGTYFARLVFGGQVEIKSLTLVR